MGIQKRENSPLIWLVCDGEPLPIDEGSPRLLRTAVLASRLVLAGFRVVYWSSNFDHTRKRRRDLLGRTMCSHGYSIHLVEGKPYRSNVSIDRIFHNLVVANRMRLAMERDLERPDLILADLPTIELASMSTSMAERLQTPILVSIRDLWPDVFLTAVPSYIRQALSPFLYPYRRMLGSALARATGIIGISENYLTWALRNAKRSRSEIDAVIPLGYPNFRTPLSGESERSLQRLSALKVDTSKTLIAFVGTFGHSYDLETVILSASLLSQRKDIQFVLAGEGTKSQKLRELASGLDNVIFPGWLSQEDISILLSHSVAGLTAYREEALQGLPNKFFEYMCHGLPIVNSLKGEASSVIEVNQIGRNYVSGNPQSLAASILEICADQKKRRQMSLSAKLAFQSKYSEDVTTEAFLSLINRTLR